MNRIGKIANIETLKENGFDIPSFDKQTIAQTPIKTNNNQILSIISDFSNTISNWISRGAGQLLGKSLGQFYSSVEKLGFKAGGEFKAAYEEAKNVNARILLGDRNVNITLQRLAAAIATTNPTKFETLAYKLFELEKDAGIDISSEEDLINNKDVLSKFVENLKQRKLLNQVMTLVKSELPDVYNALIGERDIYMAKSIIESNATKLVAVVGFAMGRFYSSVEKLGFKVGDEFKVAYEEAKNVNARILLGDRYCHITLQRIGAAFAATDPT
eukprot:gene18651-24393_t